MRGEKRVKGHLSRPAASEHERRAEWIGVCGGGRRALLLFLAFAKLKAIQVFPAVGMASIVYLLERKRELVSITINNMHKGH